MWLTGYEYRKVISIDHTKIGEDLTDFPLLVTLKTTNFDFANFMTAGNLDLRFTSSDGSTLLNYDKFSDEASVVEYGTDFLTGGTASATNIAGGAAANAVDDNTTTYWATTWTGITLPQSWAYDLGAGTTKTARVLRIKPFKNGNGGYVKDWTLWGSNVASPTLATDTDWTQVTSGQSANTDDWTTYTFANSTAYRHYKLKVSTNWRAFPDSGLYEIELFECTYEGPRIRCWVKVPSVSNTADTQICAYARKELDTDGSNASGVWNSGFKGVWHFEEIPAGVADEVKDATTNAHHGLGCQGVGTYPTTQTSFLSRALKGLGYVSGYTSFIQVTDHADLELTGDFTWTFRLNWSGIAVGDASFLGKSDGSYNGYAIDYVSGNLRFWYANTVLASWAWTPLRDVEYKLGLYRNGNTFRLFINDSEIGTAQTSATTIVANAYNLKFFTRTWTGYGSSMFTGYLDEIRLTNGTYRSESWIKAEYYAEAETLLSFDAGEIKAIEYINAEFNWRTILARKDVYGEFNWAVKPNPKFIPNIINYAFGSSTPVLASNKVPVSMAGCLVGYSIYMKNTGSAGRTVVDFYVSDVLVDSKIITADNTENVTIKHFDLSQFLYSGDTLRVDVTEVATGSDELGINVYEMTFPFAIEPMSYANFFGSVLVSGINSQYLFQTADYWLVEFNQPIKSIEYIQGITSDDINTELTGEITLGTFYNSRLKITSADVSYQKIRVKIKDMCDNIRIFDLEPVILASSNSFPSYINTDLDVYSFLSIDGYRYSFDAGVTWSDWTAVSKTNAMTISVATLLTVGQKSILFQYAQGSETFYETISSYFVTGDLNCVVSFLENSAILEYLDVIPLQKIEVYYDNILAYVTAIPAISGFDTCTVVEATKTITISAGLLTIENNIYSWDGTAYVLSPDTTLSRLNRVVYFGFNLITKVFEFREIETTNPYSDTGTISDFIKLWAFGITVVPPYTGSGSYEFKQTATETYVFNASEIPIDTSIDQDVKIRVYDAAGRYEDFTFNYYKLKYNIWRTLTVTDPDTGTEVLPGEIHDLALLDYTFESEDWINPR